jgi:opacity protein-like surface antigen
MKNKFYLIKYFFSIGIFLLSVTTTFASEKRYYIGFKGGTSVQDYTDVNFINPRITGVESDNDNETEWLASFQFGKTFSSLPLRLEFEYAKTGNNNFLRFHEPFTTTPQLIKIDSERAMFNLYYDHKLNIGTIYAGGGIGASFNETDVLQGTDSNFAENSTTDLAWSLGAGMSKRVDNFVLDFGYRYVDLGQADSGSSEFFPFDEKFEGELETHELTFGIRYIF